MTSIMSHFPILAIMALFLGAFLVALLGRKSAAVRNVISFVVTGGAMVLMLALIKPIMLDGEIITYWMGNWEPVSGWAIGIGVEVDALSLFFGLVITVAVFASCIYAFTYMKEDDSQANLLYPVPDALRLRAGSGSQRRLVQHVRHDRADDLQRRGSDRVPEQL